jgi:hypothetical protein
MTTGPYSSPTAAASGSSAEGSDVDWKVLLLMCALSSVRLINTYLRGRQLRHTVRTSLRAIPATMTEIDVRIVDPGGSSAAVQARAEPDGGEG